uniref:Uncharacterized protein n=1 Tax=Romanomermis culicivorax TaxID=13658 RepID=A0A915KDM9_ROMCU
MTSATTMSTKNRRLLAVVTSSLSFFRCVFSLRPFL